MNAESTSATILIIDDDAEIRYSLHRVLSSRNYKVITAASGEEGVKIAEKEHPHIIFLDNRMEGMSGIETLQHLRSISHEFMVIFMTAFGTTQTAIEAMKFGAYDYIVKPFDIKRVLSLTESATNAFKDLESATQSYKPLINSDDYKEGIVGSSQPMQNVFKIIGQVAASDVTVMITGESGTGKELVARCIFQHSLRGQKPFIAVNCAAIPDNLIESELFGHEKGAFTGATNQRIGKFELCDGGTIFLDEIGDMSLSTQTKILRALQEGEIQRVGGSKTISVDVRLIAATNKPLEKMVEEKTFREDLYYRLNVVRIKLPPLRERLEDIPELIDFMLQELRKERKCKVKYLSDDTKGILSKYSWPGNVRELENVIHRSAVIAQGETILSKDLPLEIVEAVKGKKPVPTPPAEPKPEEKEEVPEVAPAETRQISTPTTVDDVSPEMLAPRPVAPDTSLSSPDAVFDAVYSTAKSVTANTSILQRIEKEMIERALKDAGGNQVKTAAILGITRATLRKRIEEYNFKIS